MKMRHDMVTGIVGLLTCIFFFIMTQQVRQPANLLEPGPRLLPYVAIFLIGISSIALIVKGYKEREIAEKPYFPKGGVIKVTKSFLMLVIYAVAMTYLGFVITTPFATAKLSPCPPSSSRWSSRLCSTQCSSLRSRSNCPPAFCSAAKEGK